MADYIYSRELVNGHYNINNAYHIDGDGNIIPLSQDIIDEATLPSDVDISMVAATCTVTFGETLTAPQKTTLDTVVVTHKSYT